MKYIMLENQNGDNFPIIFPNHSDFKHSSVADVIRSLKVGYGDNWERKFRDAEIVSAGFVSFGPQGVFCHGRSESLGIGSRPQDSHIVEDQI